MNKYQLITWPNELLLQPTLEVKQEEFGTDELKNLVASMFDIMHKAGGVGLAAPQVGVLSKIFVVDLSPVPENGGFTTPKVFINPQPIGGPEDYELEEGCLSFPGIYQKVTRPKDVVITAKDIDGNIFIEKSTGLYSHVILHECDHLNGKTIYNHMSNLRRDIVRRKLNKQNKFYR